MKLITILLVIFVERISKPWPKIRNYHWFNRYVASFYHRCQKTTWLDNGFGVLMVVTSSILPAVIPQYFIAQTHGNLGWGISLLFSLLVLFYVIGPRTEDASIDDYLVAWKRDDTDAAYLSARQLLGDDSVLERTKITRKIIAFILLQSNERFLGVIFWFVILGPAGAFLYRLSCEMKMFAQNKGNNESGFIEAGIRLHAILDWLPVRITGLGYAMAGSFVDAIQSMHRAIKNRDTDWVSRNQKVVIESGMGALQLGGINYDSFELADANVIAEQIQAARSLVKRSLITWLVVFAILTITGWLS
ncbi:MAG: regulatory signaling modulator protein AmpE [Gammaproteobacteria bacterium]